MTDKPVASEEPRPSEPWSVGIEDVLQAWTEWQCPEHKRPSVCSFRCHLRFAKEYRAAAPAPVLARPDEELNYLRVKVADADKVMAAIDHAVKCQHLSSRSEIADARQNYGEPFTAALRSEEPSRERLSLTDIAHHIYNYLKDCQYSGTSFEISGIAKIIEHRIAALASRSSSERDGIDATFAAFEPARPTPLADRECVICGQQLKNCKCSTEAASPAGEEKSE